MNTLSFSSNNMIERLSQTFTLNIHYKDMNRHYTLQFPGSKTIQEVGVRTSLFFHFARCDSVSIQLMSSRIFATECSRIRIYGILRTVIVIRYIRNATYTKGFLMLCTIRTEKSDITIIQLNRFRYIRVLLY